MGIAQSGQRRERLATLYMAAITLIGFSGIGAQLFYMDSFYNIPIYILFIVFLIVSELYPIVLWKLSITLSFPLVYTLILLFGFPVAVISYSLVLFAVYLMKKRPLRLLLFTPAQHAISLFAAYGAVISIFSGDAAGFAEDVSRVAVFMVIYVAANNVLVDGLLVIRPQRYQKQVWLRKSFVETGVACFAFAYLLTMFMLGSQNRGVIDVFSYLFFYSPLVAICIITAIIVRLRGERNRLKALFSLTTELNRLLFSKQWQENVEQLFKHFIDVEATAFWVKAGNDWLLSYQDGATGTPHSTLDETEVLFADIREIQVYSNRKRTPIPADSFFQPELQAFVFAPLQVENETIGMLVVGRSRSHSFTSEEAQSMATLANQMAVLLKNYNLISEQKKRLLLEERNRIAREIHDGVAQSVAGAVMELESAERLFTSHPEKSERLMQSSTGKLRRSLKEIRQSIYELRPYPTERIGLRKAIKEKIVEMEKGGEPEITFQETGQVFPLDDMVERVMYETVQEALHNCQKHANARYVEVRLIYKEDSVELAIEDDGDGFSLVDAMMKARQQPHFGILNMNEQAEKVGGSLQIDSNKGEGTTIQLIIKNETGEEYENDSSDVG
ncbi:MAG TPA: histidine kinase [Bacillales bacterium]